MALWRLLRHGESTWNRARRVQGQDDEAVLTPEGRAQVERAAESLVGAGIELIVSSDLTRTRQSAEICAAALGVEVLFEPGLRERHYGLLERGPLEAATPELVGLGEGRVLDDGAAPEGGESVGELYRRAAACAQSLLATHGERRLLLVTHGGTVRALLAWAEGRPLVTGSPWGPVHNATTWELHTPE